MKCYYLKSLLYFLYKKGGIMTYWKNLLGAKPKKEDEEEEDEEWEDEEEY